MASVRRGCEKSGAALKQNRTGLQGLNTAQRVEPTEPQLVRLSGRARRKLLFPLVQRALRV